MPFETRQWRRFLEAARHDRQEWRFWDDLDASIGPHGYNENDFSLRELFEEFVPDGREIVGSWSPRSGGGRGGIMLHESSVDTSAFNHITGQIVYSTVLDRFNSPQFIASQLCTTVPTQFNGEKIPGVSQIGDEAEIVGEGQAYPTAGVGEEWIETPETVKRGFMVPVTKEAIFFDRTGLVVQRAADVSTWLGVNKEKRVIDVAIGTTNTYRRNGGSVVNTYQASTPWVNVKATNALVDWTDIENAELLFDGLTDPNTGEPIVVMPNTILVPSALKHTARRILNATEIQFGDGASNTTRTVGANPVGGDYTILTSQYVKARTSSDSTWYIGDFKNAFWYMENWPITSVQAPSNSEAEFTRDIVMRWKVSERGTVAVVEPRRVVKCTG